jgi:hypothetical protein
MRLIGLTLVRNEAWVIGYSLRAALQWCDHVVCLLHCCEDETPEIVERLWIETGRVTIVTDPNPQFDEMDLRQRMLVTARELGATHIAILDGDEIVTANLACYRPGLREKIALLPPGGVLACPIHNLWRSLDGYRNDDKPFGNGWVILAFGDHPEAEWKPAEDGYQFHMRIPRVGPWFGPMRWPAERERGGLMHLQHVSWRRLVAKHAWYQLQEALRWPHRSHEEIRKLYSAALDETGIRVLPVPAEWWVHGLDRSLIRPDEEPWTEVEARAIVSKYGHERFAGLDLLGII